MLTIDLVDDDRRFAGMADEWDALLRGSAASSIFLTWEWLYTWWRHLRQGRRLQVLAIREDGALVGIAPFVLARRWGRLSPLPTLEFLGTGEVGSDYLDLICRPGYEALVLDAVADHLAARRASLHLRRFEPSSALAGRLAERLRGSGWTLARSAAETCPFITLDGHTWDSYLGSLGAQHRYNVRRRLKNLERAGARFERVVCEEQLREVLPALVALHNRRWRERGGSQAFHRTALVAFHEELTRRALERGWLRLFAWRLEGRVVAALYGFLYDGRFSFYQSGFDPQAGTLSLGLAAMGLAIKSAIDEGAVAYDLLHGDEAYKFLWCRQTRELARLEVFPPTTAGHIARQAAATLRAVRRGARRLWRERPIGAAAAR